MFSKIGSFFSNFFHNVAADPVSSIKGVVQLAAAGATCYGMATGSVPVNQATTGFAAAAAVSGVHALGTDSTGATAPAATAIENGINMAAAATPQALTIADHYQAIQQQAGQAQAILTAAQEAAAALAALTGDKSTPVPMPPVPPSEGVKA